MPGAREVIEEIRRLPRMKDLAVERFAEEGGLADSLAREFGDKLKPTQLRKVFHQLKSLKMKVKRERKFERSDLVKLLPTLAYATGRGLMPKDFYDLMKECIHRDRLQDSEDFLRFAEFLEALLAFHKYRSS